MVTCIEISRGHSQWDPHRIQGDLSVRLCDCDDSAVQLNHWIANIGGVAGFELNHRSFFEPFQLRID